MFLFTDAPTARPARDTAAAARGDAATGAPAVVEAIRSGARDTGTSFDYLLATARRESGLDPNAQAGTSSASGLFQFVEQTWLGVMKSAGARLGLAPYAEAITARGDGRYAVADAETRQAILALRRDPQVSAAMAGVLTQRNREALGPAIGREPTGGDLYVAHVLGAKGAAALIATARQDPERPATLDLPEAAAANRALFYDRGGRARGAAELYALLSADRSGARAAPAPTTDVARPGTGGLRDWFQTDGRAGAVAPAVARLWQTRNAAPVGTGERAAGYFPRTDGPGEPDAEPSGSAAVVADPADQATRTDTSARAIAGPVPLPPRRPTDLVAGAPRRAALADRLSPAPRSGP